MKTTPPPTPRAALIDHARGVVVRLHQSFTSIAKGSPFPVDVADLSLAAATIDGLCFELEQGAEPPALELVSDESAPAPPAKCRHKWAAPVGDAAPLCERCGAAKSPQGRPKGPPTATVAGVTKQDPPSLQIPNLPSRAPLPPPHVEPFVTPRRGS